MLLISPATLNKRQLTPFASDVLNQLRNRRVTFRGAWPDYVQIALDGKVEVKFYGHRDGRPWIGGVQYACVFPEDNINLCDPAIVAELCEKGIALMDAT